MNELNFSFCLSDFLTKSVDWSPYCFSLGKPFHHESGGSIYLLCLFYDWKMFHTEKVCVDVFLGGMK